MGIPSYFKYISKSYNITTDINENENVDYLFLDCNSVIYKLLDNDENVMYENIVQEINAYVNILNPRKFIMIAFDGVAPLAKMKQQRERRFRSCIYKKQDDFDTCKITPGTQFMNNLMTFLSNKLSFDVPFLLSGSNEEGEGEHKIFNYIKKNKDIIKSCNVFIYGLDADLIILSLQNIKYTKSIFLFREDMNENKLLKLNINILQNDIINEMKVYTEKQPNVRIQDYLFLSFMLGNDFLPHSPFLNIRHDGIDYLTKCYIQTISFQNIYITNKEHNIEWKHFKNLIMLLASYEQSLLQKEHRNLFKTKIKDKNDIDVIPQYSRYGENYIDPYNNDWKYRYYTRLFRTEYSKDTIKNICISYLQGLQWCLMYYNGIINTEWFYPYSYPPLFSDILKYIPEFNIQLIKPKTCFFSELTQLSYVLPPKSLYLLPPYIKEKLEKVYDNYQLTLQWDYCTYLWESHPILPFISIQYVQNIVKTYQETIYNESK